MIVNYNRSGWEIITQRAHGLLAAQLAGQWKVSERPGRWVETLIAIAGHDDAEVELDGENLLTPRGGPLNFSMKAFDEPHCQRVSRFTIAKSRYIALLTSMHMDFLYHKEEKENPAAAAFLKAQRKLQTAWRRGLHITRPEAEKIYCLLEWCDALSLLLCRRDVQPEHRSVEIGIGPDNRSYQLVRQQDNRLTIDPWPFEPASFTVHYEYRELKKLQFKSSAEFRAAFVDASVKEQEWKLVNL
ncbi:MAG TPA: DUF3891 family protein [Puia sp.]|nr:DUF3891 family protein [Puia sp.]